MIAGSRRLKRDADKIPAGFKAAALPILPDGSGSGWAGLRQEAVLHHRRLFHALYLGLSLRRRKLLEETGAFPFLEALARAPSRSCEEVFLDPAFSQWLYLQPEEAAELRVRDPRGMLEKLPHSLLVPLASEGILPPCRFHLWTDAGGRVLFSGHRVPVGLGAPFARRRVRADWDGKSLRLTVAGLDVEIPCSDLLRGRTGSRATRRDDFVEGIEVDQDNPLLRQIGRDHPLLVRGQGSPGLVFSDEAGAWLGKQKRLLRAALDRLARIWPEQRRETLDYCRLFVPVAANAFYGHMGDFTGTIFYRLSDLWYQNLESLIHETCHVKLSYLGHVYPLWEGRPLKLYRSPWTGHWRAAPAMFHALCVVYLSCAGLEKALRDSGRKDPEAAKAIRSRLSFLKAGFSKGFELVRGSLRLTDCGAFFLERVEEEVRLLI